MLKIKKRIRRARFNLSLNAENYEKLMEIADKENVKYCDIIDDLMEKFLKGYKNE